MEDSVVSQAEDVDERMKKAGQFLEAAEVRGAHGVLLRILLFGGVVFPSPFDCPLPSPIRPPTQKRIWGNPLAAD